MYRLELYERELASTKKGREILGIIHQHLGEVGKMINGNREVMVTWRRNNGAAFFSQFMGTGFQPGTTMTKELDGISLDSLIRRMAVVLQDYGSPALVQTIDRYLLLVLDYAAKSDSLQGIFKQIRAYE